MKFKADQRTEFQQKPSRAKRCLTVCALLLSLGGCATSSSVVVDSETEPKTHSRDVKTVSGRAWVSVSVDGKKASFAGVVLIDRSTPGQEKLRLEALDPLGILHHLLVINAQEKTLVWIDHDERTIRTAQNNLRGVPMHIMPDLLAGVTQLSRLKDLDLSYVIEERGGVNVLKTVSSKVTTDSKNEESAVSVVYEKFASRKEYDLPRSVNLNISHSVSITLSWRSRAVNGAIRPELFNVDPVEGYRALDF